MSSTPPRRGRAHSLYLAAAALAALTLLALGTLVTPAPEGHGTHEQLGLPACVLMKLWGIPCPGCGVTTSVALAARGQLWASLLNQPFGFVLALALAGYPVWALWAQISGRDLASDLRRVSTPSAGLSVAALLIGSWLYKLAVGF